MAAALQTLFVIAGYLIDWFCFLLTKLATTITWLEELCLCLKVCRPNLEQLARVFKMLMLQFYAHTMGCFFS